MPDLTVGIAQADTTRKASDAIWKGCPWLELPPFGFNRSGITEFDDFGTLTAAGTNGALSKYKVVGTNGTAVLIATDDGGVVSMRPSTTGNNEAYLAYGQTTGGLGQFLYGAGTTKATTNRIWFECRFRVQDITSGGYFLGLAKPGDIASGFLVNSTIVVASTVNAIGLNVANGTPTKGDIVYATAAAPTTYKAGAVTLAVGAWHKFGLRYDGAASIKFYIDGTEVANTAGTFGVAPSATNFPHDVMMTALFAAKTQTTTSNNLDIDWWRYAQLIEDPTYG